MRLAKPAASIRSPYWHHPACIDWGFSGYSVASSAAVLGTAGRRFDLLPDQIFNYIRCLHESSRHAFEAVAERLSARAEQRMGHTVSGLNPILPGRSPDHLKDTFCHPSG